MDDDWSPARERRYLVYTVIQLLATSMLLITAALMLV
jgi:hypothetical protein